MLTAVVVITVVAHSCGCDHCCCLVLTAVVVITVVA